MLRTAWVLGILLGVPVATSGQGVQPQALRVRGVELHYVERGSGEPLVLLHGGQADYRAWAPQMAALSPYFRVISYSRRYHYPNHNPLTATNHSAYVEAEDLAALIKTLGLGRVHLVGTSIGAATALVFALQHPEIVRSLVLAEPPIHGWIRDSAATADVYRTYIAAIQEPAARAFLAGDDTAAMKAFVDGFAGTARFDELAPDAQATIMQNALAMKALALSRDAFPDVPKSRVRRLRMPILIIAGANTIAIHRLVNDELTRLLPRAQTARIPNAGHGSPRENPDSFNAAVLCFLAAQKQ